MGEYITSEFKAYFSFENSDLTLWIFYLENPDDGNKFSNARTFPSHMEVRCWQTWFFQKNHLKITNTYFKGYSMSVHGLFQHRSLQPSREVTRNHQLPNKNNCSCGPCWKLVRRTTLHHDCVFWVSLHWNSHRIFCKEEALPHLASTLKSVRWLR